jgi:hypothetical protein
MISRQAASTARHEAPARTAATPAACDSATTSSMRCCVSVGSPTITVRVMSDR